ncbi:MAG TPA: SO_0444 family Cu/Zn efflux transporter [Candidatus Omnitrophota bacterium]|nr:SO_0444 family Cu/Zn efflux transporter [Candidatus Omnitrophota bacterium]
MISELANVTIGIAREACVLLNAMSPYLLFGFLFAGVLHVFIDTAFVARHLGHNNLGSVVKAALFGMPLPLCSCGVIPAAVSLKREGASKGAILSFLISTPITGIDSILATYSLLGWVFTIFRIIASLVTGIFAGILCNVFEKTDGQRENVRVDECCCHSCRDEAIARPTFLRRCRNAVFYAFGDLVRDSGGSILVGLVIGGVISYAIPNEFIETYVGSGFRAMIIMLLVGIPMYVCATGSIPIAAALLMKGVDPGAVFVFLLSGPATNVVTITVVMNTLGKRTLFIYLFAISFCSIVLGYLLDHICAVFDIKGASFVAAHPMTMMNSAGYMASFTLIGLILFNLLRKMYEKIGNKKERANS